jgi:hypothetical protein
MTMGRLKRWLVYLLFRLIFTETLVAAWWFQILGREPKSTSELLELE